MGAMRRDVCLPMMIHMFPCQSEHHVTRRNNSAHTDHHRIPSLSAVLIGVDWICWMWLCCDDVVACSCFIGPLEASFLDAFSQDTQSRESSDGGGETKRERARLGAITAHALHSKGHFEQSHLPSSFSIGCVDLWCPRRRANVMRYAVHRSVR